MRPLLVFALMRPHRRHRRRRPGRVDPRREALGPSRRGHAGVKARVRRATAAGYVIGAQSRRRLGDALISATADVAERVELHETRNMSGMMMMEKVPKVELAPGSRVALKPGSYHLMLIGLKRALTPGQTVNFTLEFERAGRITTRAEVR